MLTFGLLLGLLLIFKGWMYRKTVNYVMIGQRDNIRLTNKTLIQNLNEEIKGKDLSLEKLIKIADQTTTQQLKFTFGKASNNSNQVVINQQANCIGYSALFNSTMNYLIRQQGKEKMYKAKHLKGQLYFLGMNVHDFFDHPFFKDHDFNEVINHQEGTKIYIDPSVSDYLGIRRVSSK